MLEEADTERPLGMGDLLCELERGLLGVARQQLLEDLDRRVLVADRGVLDGLEQIVGHEVGLVGLRLAVGVGRPYLWGLGAFGEPGVAKVLEILRTETRVAMMQCGVRSVKEFTPAFVRRV